MGVLFKGKHIGLPRVGCGLGGGDWMVVERMIRQELKECTVTVVDYERTKSEAGSNGSDAKDLVPNS
jgi:hypothetical protein